MASETGPDLSNAVAEVERLMDDACVVLRFPPADDVEVDELGNVVTPAPTVVYGATSTGDGGRSLSDADGTGGRCKVKTETDIPSAFEGTTDIGGRYTVGLPLDAPAVLPYDLVVITSSRRDPTLVQREFSIIRIESSTFAVQRKLRCSIPGTGEAEVPT